MTAVRLSSKTTIRSVTGTRSFRVADGFLLGGSQYLCKDKVIIGWHKMNTACAWTAWNLTVDDSMPFYNTLFTHFLSVKVHVLCIA
jgi:hypothetical protein